MTSILLFKNSLIISVLATVAAVALGFLAALGAAAMGGRWRRCLLVGAGIGLALPPFLITNVWLELVGQTGSFHRWFPINIYSSAGAVWILTLMAWPLTLFGMLATWQRLDASMLEADSALRGGLLVRRLLWPLSKSTLVQTSLLTFVLAFNNFTVPALLQVKAFPAELWVSFNTTLNYAQAVQLSLPTVLVPLLLIMWFRSKELPWPRWEGLPATMIFRRSLGSVWSRAGVCALAGLAVLAAGVPLGDLLLSRRTWEEMLPAFWAGQGAIRNSVMEASIAATLVALLGLTGWRWPVGTWLWIPFLVPGVLLGIGFIYLGNLAWFTPLYPGFGFVVVALALRYLGPGWQTAATAMRRLDETLEDEARVAGATGWSRFRHVHWPQIGPQMCVAWYVTYLFCLWDVETQILIVPPGGETLALRVFNLLHYGHHAHVNALCLWLLILAGLPLVVWQLAGWRRRRLVWSSAVRFATMGSAVGGLALAGCAPVRDSEGKIESQLFERVQIIGTRGTGLGQFNKPRSIALDADNNLYVVDMTGRLQKFSPDGTFLQVFQMPQTDKGRPKGMCRDLDGNIVVIEPHYARINHLTPGLELAAQWGRLGTSEGQMTLPRAAAVNSRGEIYISEYGLAERVQRFTAQGGQFLNAFGQAGNAASDFNRPEGLGIDRADRLYVADSCNHRIQIFSQEGRFLRSYGKAGAGRGELSYPYDVQVDGEGRQYVCEFGNSRIQIFDARDQVVEILGKAGTEPGQFNNPWSIALDSSGNLFVADSMNHRVQKFIRRRSAAGVPGHP